MRLPLWTLLGAGVKDLERRCRVSEDLVDRLPICIAVASWSGRISFCNQKFCRLFDLGAKDVEQGVDLQNLLPQQAFKKLAREAALLGAAKDEDVDVNFDGRDRSFRLSIFGLRNEDDSCAMGVVLEALEVFSDD